MTEKLLEPFFRTYSLPKETKFPIEGVIQDFTHILPESLLEIWYEHGWGGYRDGLFWFVNPKEYNSLLKTWNIGASQPIVFLRSSFGDLFFLDSSTVYRIRVHHGEILEWDDSLNNFLKFRMRYEPYLRENFDLELHEACLEKLGPISSDEMFGFEPALALGGKEEVDFAKKLKLLEHVDILFQLC